MGSPHVPAGPTNLMAVARSTNVRLSWTNNADNSPGFLIEVSAGGKAFHRVGSAPANTTKYRLAGLTSGTTYVFRIRARNSTGVSAYSETVTITL